MRESDLLVERGKAVVFHEKVLKDDQRNETIASHYVLCSALVYYGMQKKKKLVYVTCLKYNHGVLLF